MTNTQMYRRIVHVNVIEKNFKRQNYLVHHIRWALLFFKLKTEKVMRFFKYRTEDVILLSFNTKK